MNRSKQLSHIALATMLLQAGMPVTMQAATNPQGGYRGGEVAGIATLAALVLSGITYGITAHHYEKKHSNENLGKAEKGRLDAAEATINELKKYPWLHYSQNPRQMIVQNLANKQLLSQYRVEVNGAKASATETIKMLDERTVGDYWLEPKRAELLASKRSKREELRDIEKTCEKMQQAFNDFENNHTFPLGQLFKIASQQPLSDLEGKQNYDLVFAIQQKFTSQSTAKGVPGMPFVTVLERLDSELRTLRGARAAALSEEGQLYNTEEKEHIIALADRQQERLLSLQRTIQKLPDCVLELKNYQEKQAIVERLKADTEKAATLRLEAQRGADRASAERDRTAAERERATRERLDAENRGKELANQALNILSHAECRATKEYLQAQIQDLKARLQKNKAESEQSKTAYQQSIVGQQKDQQELDNDLIKQNERLEKEKRAIQADLDQIKHQLADYRALAMKAKNLSDLLQQHPDLGKDAEGFDYDKYTEDIISLQRLIDNVA